MQTLLDISAQDMLDFRAQHQLPATFQRTADESYLPLARMLPEFKPEGDPLFLGINGAQGTGKSTLADFLRLATKSFYDWNVAVLSIDDFYLTRAEREVLASDIHPLLRTRGVPGTHDIEMLAQTIDWLRQAGPNDTVALPRFDKAVDDRACSSHWPTVTAPLDLIILEGWCVGTRSQPEASLLEPVNALERDEDSDGAWRRYVNDQLRLRYSSVFDQLDLLVFLRAPGFDAIYRWRLEQEQKLAAKSTPDAMGLMDEAEIERFIQFYERLTIANLATLADQADVVFGVDESHVARPNRLSRSN